MESRILKQPAPRFVVIWLANKRVEIVGQGRMSLETFRFQFLDPYELSGERYHPGKDAVIGGVLLASNESTVVTVPIWIWETEDGVTRLLCQASDDGQPPAFSVFALSESDLLNQVSKELTK